MALTQPDFNLPEYKSNNIFWPNYGPPNCTWYANGRMQQLGYNRDVLNHMTGNANQWAEQHRAYGGQIANTPQVACVAQWDPNRLGAGPLGHVAVVEQINSDGSILISESNWANQLWDTRVISRDAPSRYIIVLKNGGSCASSPSRENCDSKDPQEQGCGGDAYTVTGATADIKDNNGAVIGRVELRYSKTCQSNWSRVTSNIGAASVSGTINREGGGSYSAKFDNVTSIYTDMVHAPDQKAQACGSVNGHSACTDWK